MNVRGEPTIKVFGIAVGLISLFAALFMLGYTFRAKEHDMIRPADRGRMLVAEGGGDVVVWRDSDAMSEGYKLRDAGVHQSRPELLMPLVACFAPSGSGVVTTSSSFLTRVVLVIDGEVAGCRGTVPMEAVKVVD